MFDGLNWTDEEQEEYFKKMDAMFVDVAFATLKTIVELTLRVPEGVPLFVHTALVLGTMEAVIEQAKAHSSLDARATIVAAEESIRRKLDQLLEASEDMQILFNPKDTPEA